MDLNLLSKQIYKDNCAKGFYDKPRETGTLIALMHSELSEALEADRKNLMDDKLTHRSGLEVELADCLIRILDFCGHRGFDIQGAVDEKLAYNRTRPYKHNKSY
jgi:NTP pyrophosphatase (non-canonical NTP hydrolase)